MATIWDLHSYLQKMNLGTTHKLPVVWFAFSCGVFYGFTLGSPKGKISYCFCLALAHFNLLVLLEITNIEIITMNLFFTQTKAYNQDNVNFQHMSSKPSATECRKKWSIQKLMEQMFIHHHWHHSVFDHFGPLDSQAPRQQYPLLPQKILPLPCLPQQTYESQTIKLFHDSVISDH